MSHTTVCAPRQNDPAAALAAHAQAIRAIGKRVIADVIEIGERLTEAKKLVGHGGWLPWLDREFGWTEDTALNFMRCHDLAKSRNFRDLSLPVSALYLISKPSTPDSARDAVLDLAAKGERVTHAQAKDIVDSAKNRARPALLREMKLGEDVVAKIRGTSLDKAREQDELIMLNRGAPQGEVTPVVARLVADAAAGKDVSAVATTAQRGEVARLEARIEELHATVALKDQRSAALEREIRDLRACTQHDDGDGPRKEAKMAGGGTKTLPASKTMSGRELEFRSRDPDSAHVALLRNALQAGHVALHRLTQQQAQALIPLPQRAAISRALPADDDDGGISDFLRRNAQSCG